MPTEGTRLNGAKQRSLGAAKAAKDDVQTQLTDIEEEVKHYKKHFKGKVVEMLCITQRVKSNR